MTWQDIVGCILIALVVSVIGAGAYISVAGRTETEVSPCNDNAHIVLLVDRTDPYSAETRERIVDIMRDMAASLSVGDRLTIMPIDGTVSPEPLISLCRPPSEAHWLYENERMIKEQYAAHFGAPLAFWEGQIETPARAEASLIFETIRAVTELPTFTPSVPHRRIVVVSDFLQHMPPVYSQYRDGLDYEQFRQSAYAAQVSAPLEGVMVQVVYLANERAVRFQGTAHRAFWLHWFQDEGATMEVLS